MMPLLQKGNQQVYKPFSFTDINCTVDKMPPPEEGRGLCMTKFCQYTMGHTLALGDWRGLLGKQVGVSEVQQVQEAVGTAGWPDDTPLSMCHTKLVRAMRENLPTPVGAIHTLCFTINEGKKITTFLNRCKMTWTNTADSSNKLQTNLFRQAVMPGMPKPVKDAMEENLDISGCPSEQW